MIASLNCKAYWKKMTLLANLQNQNKCLILSQFITFTKEIEVQ